MDIAMTGQNTDGAPATPRPWAGPVALVVFFGLWYAGAVALDRADPDTIHHSFSYGLLPADAAVPVGLPLLLVLVVSAAVALRVPSAASRAAAAGGAICALAWIPVAVVGVWFAASGSRDSVFGLLTLLASLVLLAPGYVVWRARTRS